MGSRVTIVSAVVRASSGGVAAAIDLVPVGGGTQVVTVDGTPEERVHPVSEEFHVRLVSPDRMVPDDLRTAASYEDAVRLAEAYAARLDEHADRIAGLTDDLRV